jgi:mxaK protein
VAPELNPRRLKALLGVLALLALAAGVEGWRLLQAREWNAQIADGRIVTALGRLPGEARFAQAWHLARAGELQRALALYQEIATAEDSPLAVAARYNIGNLFLAEALRARRDGDEHAALPYLELAKQAYRDTLRAEPDRYEARYNLERALRLMPESGGPDEGGAPAPSPAERAVTTMKGFTLGLP